MLQNNSCRKSVRGRRILRSKIDHRGWLNAAACLAVLASFSSLTETGIANPKDGQVVSGVATIGSTSPNTLQVDQHTKVVIIDWSSFNIAGGETTKFNQPSASAMAVNRIGGNNPSQILGSLLANGRIVLINGNGIVFGPNARIDVGALLATTSDASNADIASGKATFDKAGNPHAMIANQGSINASNGMVGLVAPAVRNDGIVTARLGSVTLGASNVFTVDFTGDGLISFPLDAKMVSRAIDANGKPVEALVVNNGKIVGSTVLLSARAARDLVSNVVSAGGTIAATSVRQEGGKVVLDGGDGGVLVNGTITAVGRTGGDIVVAGGNIALSRAMLDASGAHGGGTIKVGDWSSRSATVDSTTKLSASATTNGNGGAISVIAGQTQFAGQAEAKGGLAGGNGGLVETSGHSLDIAGAQVDNSSPLGAAGAWLLDPDDYTIGATQAATIASNLASGNVTIMTTAAGSGGNGDIFVNSAVSWASANSLTLSAYRNIAVGANIANTGSATVVLHADNSGTGTGTVSFAGGKTVSTSGVVSIFYNPSVNLAGSVVNATSYRNPTENFAPNVIGGGTLTSYMLVNSIDDLQNIRNNLPGTYALGRDIDASATATWNAGAGFNPIGSDTGRPSDLFSGTFDGDSHTIGNLTINRPSGIDVGLFGVVGTSGTVRNVGLLGGNVTGSYTVGELAGANYGTITQTYTTGAVSGVGSLASSTGNNVGGLVGWNAGTITQSYTTGAVNGITWVGGLVGGNSGTIMQSYAAGAVSGLYEVGGLAGVNNGTITQSYATGAVDGETWVGGLVGDNYSTITQSYASGAVSGIGNSSEIGGLVGRNQGGGVAQSYATGAVSGNGEIGGLVGRNSIGTITQSYATGAASGSYYVGGLVGYNLSASIAQSYAAGTVSSGLDVGGLVGLNDGGGTIAQSYWDTQSTGRSNGVGSGSASGVSGLTNAQARTQSSYVGWDFATDWFMIDGETRPFLRWEYSTTITNAHQLQLMAMDLSASYTLANDINFGPALAINANGYYPGMWSSNGFVPVGNEVSMFKGTFDGESHMIGNLTIYRPSGNNVGLFGYIGSEGTIRSLGLLGGNVTGALHVGPLAGVNAGTVTQSYASSVVNGTNDVGGLVGCNCYDGSIVGTISQSYATGAVNALQFGGGLVGYNAGTIAQSHASGAVSGDTILGGLAGDGGTIMQSYATGTVSGSGDYVGGLAAENANITQSYATGAVSGRDYVGGLVGGLVAWNSKISQSYATGAVHGNNYVGGLMGDSLDQTISQSYATGAVSGAYYVGGLVGRARSMNHYRDSPVMQSYATGAVSGIDYVGGLVGSNGTLITQSYATGAVSGSGSNVGGLAGNNVTDWRLTIFGTITQSYWDIESSGRSNGVGGGGSGDVTGLTSAEARTQSSYAGWDFTTDWFMTGDTRPFGRWEYSTTITNAHQLQLVAMDLSASYTLGNDIDLGPALAADAHGNYPGMWSSSGFVPIGNDASQFSGTFDGDSHTIGNLTINRPSGNNVGLFGVVATSGTLRNVGLLGGGAWGYDTVGELAGQNYGMITQSYATGVVSGSGGLNGVGGLVGANSGGRISDSYATGAVTGTGGASVVGGLVGVNSFNFITETYGTITQSYATGVVGGAAVDVGGLVGFNYGGRISDSYATGSVSGYSFGGGGLVGYNSGTISDSHATGAVINGFNDSVSVGGLVGFNSGGISDSYSTGAVTDVNATDNHGAYGGLVGWNDDGTIERSYATGAVAGVDAIDNHGHYGGLVGLNDSGTISDSYATGAVSGNTGVGGLVGGNVRGSTISDSHATGAVYGDTDVGGLAGYNTGTISNSFATGTVAGTIGVGGLVGWNGPGTITQSYATGTVTGTYDSGGLAGGNDKGGTISDSYATGTVYGDWVVGGLVGYNAGTISDSFATGTVTGTYDLGGLVGWNDGGAIRQSYWDTQSSGTTVGVGSGDSSGVTGLTTAQLTSGHLPDGFDHAVWGGQAGHYPCLLWQAGCMPSITAITYVIGNSASTYGTMATLGAVTLTGVSASDLANVVPVVGLYDSSNNAVTLSAALNAGTFTEKVASLTGSAAGYYTIASTGNTDGILIVNPAPLTVAVNSAARIYGDTNPIFSATITGFVLGQDRSVLSGLTLSTLATQSSNVGSYAITSSGGTAANYVIASRTDGTLSINPASLTLVVNNASRTYGDVNPSFGATITGFKLGQDSNVLSGLTFSTAATQSSDVGSYAIASSGGAATNYVIVSRTNGTLTINPAQLTVAVNNASRTYGDANPAFGATITGFKLGQDASVLSGLTFATSATVSSDLGAYAIVSSGGTATDYVVVSRINGTLTIIPRLSWTNPAAIAALRLEEDLGNDCDHAILPFCYPFDQIDVGNLLIANNDNLACILAPDLVECRSRVAWR